MILPTCCRCLRHARWVQCVSASLISVEESCYGLTAHEKNDAITAAQRIKYVNITLYFVLYF